MAVYAVVVTEAGVVGNMEAAITGSFLSHDFIFLGNGTWFVYTEILSTKELTDYLRGGESANVYNIRSFVVLPVNSYYGMHAQSVWEWLAAKGA